MAAITSTAANTKASSVASTASAQNASASPAYRVARARRWLHASMRATRSGVVRAGTNCMATKRPAVAIGLPVSSKTITASAISPSQLPSSFVKYAVASRLKPGRDRGLGAERSDLTVCQRFPKFG